MEIISLFFSFFSVFFFAASYNLDLFLLENFLVSPGGCCMHNLCTAGYQWCNLFDDAYVVVSFLPKSNPKNIFLICMMILSPKRLKAQINRIRERKYAVFLVFKNIFVAQF